MRAVRLASRPVGKPVPGKDLVLDEQCPRPNESQLEEGQLLVKNEFLTLDPAMRGWMRDQKSYIPPVKIGAVMRGSSIGTVIASRDAGFKVGDWVNCGLEIGWQEYGVVQAAAVGKIELENGVPPTVHLGVLGGTGLTAYFGLKEVGRPVRGETVLVSAAAGATGSVVCQLAKQVYGCRVVGIAGGPDKCRWLETELGVDAAIDYKKEDGKAFRKDLRAACPDGVDVFFDNVGGWILEDTLKHINKRARVVLCGAISGYNATSLQPGPSSYLNLINTSSRMEGFILFDYAAQFEAARAELARYLREGRLAFTEERVQGLQAAPRALLKLFGEDGGNRGRLVIDIHAQPSPEPRL